MFSAFFFNCTLHFFHSKLILSFHIRLSLALARSVGRSMCVLLCLGLCIICTICFAITKQTIISNSTIKFEITSDNDFALSSFKTIKCSSLALSVSVIVLFFFVRLFVCLLACCAFFFRFYVSPTSSILQLMRFCNCAVCTLMLTTWRLPYGVKRYQIVHLATKLPLINAWRTKKIVCKIECSPYSTWIQLELSLHCRLTDSSTYETQLNRWQLVILLGIFKREQV